MQISVSRNAVVLLMVVSTFAGLQMARAEATLSFQKVGGNDVKIVVSSTEPIAAIQFTIRGTDVTLADLKISDEGAGFGWTTSYHLIDESTMNVILLRTGRDLPAGTLSLAIVSLRSSLRKGRLSFSRVVVSNPHAQSVTATGTDFEWDADQTASFDLAQNYPNPFNPSTTIPYRLDLPGQVRLSVYDVAGREISRVFDSYQLAGSYFATWSGTDDSGTPVPSGVYFVRLQVDETAAVRKMTLTR